MKAQAEQESKQRKTIGLKGARSPRTGVNHVLLTNGSIVRADGSDAAGAAPMDVNVNTEAASRSMKRSRTPGSSDALPKPPAKQAKLSEATPSRIGTAAAGSSSTGLTTSSASTSPPTAFTRSQTGASTRGGHNSAVPSAASPASTAHHTSGSAAMMITTPSPIVMNLNSPADLHVHMIDSAGFAVPAPSPSLRASHPGSSPPASSPLGPASPFSLAAPTGTSSTVFRFDQATQSQSGSSAALSSSSAAVQLGPAGAAAVTGGSLKDKLIQLLLRNPEGLPNTAIAKNLAVPLPRLAVPLKEVRVQA